MSTEFDNLGDDEKIKAENDFLKMKMMLEHGANFGDMGNGLQALDPSIENMFLRNVMEFEKNYNGDRKEIKIYDKIGCPQQFKPAAKIPDDKIEEAWEELDLFLQNNDICVSALSPKVTTRELYRFTVEELFKLAIDDHHMPGFTTHFTYDEFYPDVEFENTSIAVDDCISNILAKEPIDLLFHFKEENINFNNHRSLTEIEFKDKLNAYKSAYDSITDVEVIPTGFNKDGDDYCQVNGNYTLTAFLGEEAIHLGGNWKVAFEKEMGADYWLIEDIQIEGIAF